MKGFPNNFDVWKSFPDKKAVLIYVSKLQKFLHIMSEFIKVISHTNFMFYICDSLCKNLPG